MWRPEFGPNAPKSGPKLGFCSFFKLSSLVFLEIAYNDSLQKFLTSRGGKIREKDFWGPNLGRKSQNRV